MTNKNDDKCENQQLRSLLQTIDELREKENEEKLRKELEKIKQMLIMYGECILKRNASKLRDTSDACFPVCLPATSQEQPVLEPTECPESRQEEVSHKHEAGKSSKELTCMKERSKLSQDQCREAVKEAEDIKQMNSFLKNEDQMLLEELETMKVIDRHVVASQATEEITQLNRENPSPELIGERERITEEENPPQMVRDWSCTEELTEELEKMNEMRRQDEAEYERTHSSDSPFRSDNCEIAAPELYQHQKLEKANQLLQELVADYKANMVTLMIQVSEMRKTLLSLQIERASLQKSFSEAQAQLRSETKSNVALRSKIQQLRELLEQQRRQSTGEQEEDSSSSQLSSQELPQKKKKKKKTFWRRFIGLCLCGRKAGKCQSCI
ncbi:unnamed protein product [Pleuronectes platessa]|uniref:Uncharacterized protein n=1 Tax=Pleuronectes platessa TaxID=8262 RepID=A0A9N7Y154_PLEPL|nr:unnamed protein product [Pleuronectes platessa]